MGLVTFSKQHQRAPSTLLPCEDNKETAIYEPESGPLADSESASALILNFPVFKNVRNKFVTCKLPSLWDFVIAAQIE